MGCLGWKYFSDHEHPNAQYAIELPSYLVDTLRELAGHDRVVNSTTSRNCCCASSSLPSEIAYFEYTNIQASESVKRMIFGMREGMTDHEVIALGGTCGEPLRKSTSPSLRGERPPLDFRAPGMKRSSAASPYR